VYSACYVLDLASKQKHCFELNYDSDTLGLSHRSSEAGVHPIANPLRGVLCCKAWIAGICKSQKAWSGRVAVQQSKGFAGLPNKPKAEERTKGTNLVPTTEDLQAFWDDRIQPWVGACILVVILGQHVAWGIEKRVFKGAQAENQLGSQ
jgi:hypothetical protein